MRLGFADNLGRLRAVVDAGLPLPDDLGQWAIDEIEAKAYAAHIRRERDARLRTAAALIGGTLGEQIARIRKEAQILDRCWNRAQLREVVRGTIEGEILAARLVMRIPERRQLYSILAHAKGMQSAA